MKRLTAIILIIVSLFLLVSCSGTKHVTTPSDITPIEQKEPKKDLIIPNADKVIIDVPPSELSSASPEEAICEFAVDTMKHVYKGDENVLISPVSISLALGLTSGGAKGETLAQFEKVLGRGVSMDEMTQFYSRLAEKIDDSERVDIEVANSVWVRDDKDMISVNEDFIDFADEVYDSEIYTETFDDSTVKKINDWVADNTDGMIDQIIDSISSDTVMYLINALAFDAEWQRAYTDTSDHFTFTNVAGEKETVTGMYSTEAKYLEDESTTGFIKNYKGGEYGFAVLLPNENIDINTYLSELTGQKLLSLLDNVQTVSVEAKLPKFSFEYSTILNDSLKAMGMSDAFDPVVADLTGLGESNVGRLHISRVLHKTFIEVAEKGTRAAAVTAVEVNTESVCMPPKDIKYVTADRPFVFAIIDNETNVPLFLGAVLSVK